VVTLSIENQIYYRSMDVAEMYGVDRRTVNNWFRKGTMPGRVVGRNIFIHEDAVKPVLDRQPVGAR
jgi:predicted site-specific integrase-resolvase